MKLRDYQIKTLHRITTFLSEPEEELIIKLYTGLGKTFLMPRIADILIKQNYAVLVLSDIMQLIYQLEEHCKNVGLNVSKIEAKSKTKINSDIILASEQTLINRLEEIKIDKPIIILYDEAHKRRNGKRFKNIIRHFKPKKLIGFTATPFDMFGVRLFDNIYEPISYKEAEQNGYLSKIDYFVNKLIDNLDFDSLDKSVGSDYTAKDIELLYDNGGFKDDFIDFIKHLDLSNRHTLIFTASISMAEKITSLIKKTEPRVGVVHSKNKNNENQELIEGFKVGSIKVLVSVTSLTIGFDAPNADTLINLRPTKSIPLFHQIIGRGSRIHNDKSKVEFYDLTNTLLKYGFPEEFRCYDSKEGLIELLEKNKENGTYLRNTEPRIDGSVEFSESKIKEFKIRLERLKKESLEELSIDELRLLFDNETDPLVLIKIANIVYKRKYNISLTNEQINWIVGKMNQGLKIMDEKYNARFKAIKAYKTRIRNIINSGKKLTSMGYFPSWFYQNYNKGFLK